MSEGATASGAREEVERLAQEFVERRRRGERPAIEEYAAAHPALAAEIRELFTTLLIVEDLGASFTGSAARAPPAAEESAPVPGLQQVGEYCILREIGRGGMGVVYEAEQASLGRRVALKVLPFHSLLDQKRLERFQQEARAAARLSHPNIVPVYGVGEHLGMHYYVMQFIPGQGLNRVIEEVRRLREAGEPDGDAVAPFDVSSSSSLAAGLESRGIRGARERYFRNMARLARDAALALDYAHAEGILHRDVKPSNLLLDPSGRVWLTDFGLAKAEGSDELTRSGDFVGTILYMAPERFQGWSDPRSDVYGLGITLHELLTLRPAFAQRDRGQLLRKVVSEEPPAPRRFDRAIPRDLENVVLKAIAKEPAQRYGSARAMAQDLDRFLEGLPVEARRSHALGRVGRWCARNPLPAMLTAAVLVLLVAVAVISAVAAVSLAVKDEQRLEKLRTAYLAEANALRASVRPGRRFDALVALREATRIRPGPDLVDAAIACFAQVDLRSLKTWAKKKDEKFHLSADGSTAALAQAGGEIVIRAAGDGQDLFRLPAPGFRVSYTWARFSGRGKLLAARYEHGGRSEWKVWDLDRRLVRAEVKDAGDRNCIDFSPDNRWIVLGTKELALRLLDLDAGTPLGEVGRGLAVQDVAVHPGARLIAFSSQRTRRVHIHDREAGQGIRTLAGTEGEMFYEVAWHPDGRNVAAANADHLVYLWNAETGERSRILQGHWAEVMGVNFSPRGYLLASWGWDPAVRFWDPGSDRPLLTIPHTAGYFSRDQQACWTVAPESVELWELASPMPAFTLFGHEGRATKQPHSISLAPGGRLAATGGDDGVRLWDLAARRELAHLPDGKVMSVLFDPAGQDLYVSGWAGLRRWPLRSLGEGSTRIAIGPPRQLSQLDRWQRADLSGDGRRMAALHQQDHAHLFDPADPERTLILRGPPSPSTIALSPDGAWAATGSRSGEEVWLWDVRGGEAGSTSGPVRKFPAPRAEVKFHPAGTRLAICTPQDLALWTVPGGQLAWRIERARGLTLPGLIAFDREGKIAVVTHNDSRLWIVDAASGRKLSELEASDPVKVTCLALEEGMLAASNQGRRFHVWDLNGLAREIAGLGLSWDVPAAGQALEDLPPVRVAIVEESLDLLEDESFDLAPRALFRPSRGVPFLSELVSCAEIDRTLAAPSLLIAEGEEWKFFRGRVKPSSGTAWASLDHDDGNWEEGRSELSGYLHQRPEGTFLADQVDSYTTLYARREFEVADPAAISRLILAAEVEDGLVAYLNGGEIGRANAGKPGERLSFKSLAMRKDRDRVTEVFEINTALLRPGRNVLALQVLSFGLDSRLHILPVLAAVPSPEAERDRRRTQNLLAGPDGEAEASLLAYREGRILQRAGQAPEALERFERASELDRGSAEPLLRRLACHRALGELARAEALAREAIEQGKISEDGRLWRAWLKAALVGLRRSPAEALASLPRDPRATAAGTASDHRWLLEDLAAQGAVRMNCGGVELESRDGKRWSRDRFFLGGSPFDKGISAEVQKERASGDEALHATERDFHGAGSFRRGYSIPLPPGRYRVSLHFTEQTHHWPGYRVFDVLLEGRTVLEGYDPLRVGFAVTDIRSVEIMIGDGALDLDFLAHRDRPRIAAIEVETIVQ